MQFMCNGENGSTRHDCMNSKISIIRVTNVKTEHFKRGDNCSSAMRHISSRNCLTVCNPNQQSTKIYPIMCVQSTLLSYLRIALRSIY